jgi:predicted PurR-regulated permease PerM
MLWGTLAFLLNFVPIIGPLIGVLIFILAGALVAENIWAAVVPAGL